jgi:radical SAM protein with 4Fe4S-binding SPASM domain
MKPSAPHYQLKEAGLRSPGTLTLAITGACNLTCQHCWVRAGGVSSPGDVPLGTVRRIVNEFAQLGGRAIRITGGEPLCHPDWLEIVGFSCSLGFAAVTLQTNAMLLKDEHLAFLRADDFPGLSIQVSLDGASPRTHDLVRGEGAFSCAWQGIELLVREGLASRISIFLTEMRHNLHEIPALLDLAAKMGITAVSSGTMVQCGRAAEASLVAPPDVEQYLALLKRYDQDAHFRNLYARAGSVAAVEWHKGAAVRSECCIFVENPYLTPGGRLYPCLLCHADEYSVTAVFEKGLAVAFAEGAPLWSSLQRLSRCRADAIPECRDCPVKPFCGGGCMGRAWGSCRNLLAADDRCQVRRVIYRQLCENSPL